jgi:hypothetical protein
VNKDTLPVRPAKVPAVLPDDPEDLTVDVLKAVMPKRQRGNITQAFVDSLNSLAQDPEVRIQFRENFLGYTKVLEEPNSTLPGYVSAVKYVSYKLMGYTNQDAWIKTFPDRYQRLLDKEAEAKYIRSVISAYNRGKMVNQIREQAMIPTWVLNQDVYQDAIIEQNRLMCGAKSEKVRSDAANSLLTHLRQPDATKVTVDIGVVENDSVKELRHAMYDLVTEQRKAIAAGARTAHDIAESNIIDVTPEYVDGKDS